jgi:hypothetical protein
LKEVYLFGCNTLNPEAARSATPEIVRSLVRSGHSSADAERVAQILNERHAETNRDRMRQIFRNVPVIYGFSSKAPLGRNAAPVLERYFQGGGASEIASGHASAKLLAMFAQVSMTSTSGSTDGDAQASYRSDVCHFVDDRLSPRQKVDFVHDLLRRDMAEVRLFLDRIEQYAASLTPAVRLEQTVATALRAIATDHGARERYLEFVRDADEPAIRVRMVAVAERFGWLTPAEKHGELVRMIDDQLRRSDVGAAEVDVICTLNEAHALDDARAGVEATAATLRDPGRAGVLACLGDAAAHARVLQGLSSGNERDLQIAQVYLRHRPIVDVDELRVVSSAVSRMQNAAAQARALDVLAGHRLSDRETLGVLTRLFPATKSLDVQRAIAGVLIRADYDAFQKPEVLRALRQHRLKSSDGRDLIDVLIQRLQANLPPAA